MLTFNGEPMQGPDAVAEKLQVRSAVLRSHCAFDA